MEEQEARTELQEAQVRDLRVLDPRLSKTFADKSGGAGGGAPTGPGGDGGEPLPKIATRALLTR